MLLLVLMKAYLEVVKKDERTLKFINGIFSIVGVIMAVYIVDHIGKNYHVLFTLDNLKSLVLAPILTLLYLPVLYGIALYTHYESVFMRVDFMRKPPREGRSIKIALLKFANLNLNKISYLEKNLYRVEEYDAKSLITLLRRVYTRTPKAALARPA